MPVQTGDGSAFFATGMKLFVHFPRLPVPEAHVAARVTRSDKLAVR